MKSSILIFISLIAASLSAATLPEDHFLFPRDREVLWISGIEEVVSFNDLRALAKQCKIVREFDSCLWIENFKQAHIQTFDSLQLNEQIVFLGERHIDPTHQAALNEIIHKNDFNVLALEMMNQSDQSFIDQYLRDEISLEDLQIVFALGWNYSNTGYMKAIESAKKKGMKILALDNRPLYDRENFSENLRKRDEFMAGVLNQYLSAHPQDRILVYSGKMHAFKSHSSSDTIKSISELVKVQDKASYFLFGPKEKNVMTYSLKLFVESEQSIVIKSDSFNEYIDGAIFIK
ncbi:MAG: hypothetical protein Fur0010_13610 [Bdellovibrio sp.]